ncbi:diiron oxygenase [Sphingomonas sp. LaA6.9]|uniref:diiron oxygenase n=1 Tax=Sphingomonas sp. LaA6.9 TaxID=2919914 RepID=UPI001F4F5668|nr:diiron oxygenase [Sphingomonas sp. LaA6.9]MCJ8158482.1 diiron oxygenase [Sphingomonas sp. LaA6.9]
MYQHFSYEAVLSASQRATWQIADVIGPDATLDFSRPFMPQALARTAGMEGLSDDEKRILNQIRGHEYLSIFGLVEEFILPFVLDHARPHLSGDDWRVRALLQFAGEEAKHIQLFKRFHEAFVAGFTTECAVIGPAEAVAAEVLRHDPLAVALVILQIEWMTQSHYVDSVRDDDALDPLFKSLLKHHWMEEAQHARLDTLMVEALAEGRDARGIDYAIDEYLEIGAWLDAGLRTQTEFNLAAFERACGRTLGTSEREAFLGHQHQAARWTYLGSGMAHPKFRATLKTLSREACARIEAVAPAFA